MGETLYAIDCDRLRGICVHVLLSPRSCRDNTSFYAVAMNERFAIRAEKDLNRCESADGLPGTLCAGEASLSRAFSSTFANIALLQNQQFRSDLYPQNFHHVHHFLLPETLLRALGRDELHGSFESLFIRIVCIASRLCT